MSTEIIATEAKPKATENWAEMSDGHEEEVEDDKVAVKVVKKKAKGFKNKAGDYVVTTIDIPDIRTKKNKDEEGGESSEASDSDSGYDEEDDVPEATKEADKVEGKLATKGTQMMVSH